MLPALEDAMGNPTDPDTLSDVLATFEMEGYTTQMAARPHAHVLCMGCHQESRAGDLRIDALERMEGASDPADMLAVAAAVCPICQAHGTLVLGYGPEAGLDDAEVLANLADVEA